MFTNLMLHLCQSDCLCRCQMYPFNAFYVTYDGNYKRYPSVFDLRAYSTGVSLTIRLDILFMFSQGKVSITLLLHTHFFNRSSINLISSTGKRWKKCPDIVCDCCCMWAQHNTGLSTSNVAQKPSSVARLKLDSRGARLKIWI